MSETQVETFGGGPGWPELLAHVGLDMDELAQGQETAVNEWIPLSAAWMETRSSLRYRVFIWYAVPDFSLQGTLSDVRSTHRRKKDRRQAQISRVEFSSYPGGWIRRTVSEGRHKTALGIRDEIVGLVACDNMWEHPLQRVESLDEGIDLLARWDGVDGGPWSDEVLCVPWMGRRANAWVTRRVLDQLMSAAPARSEVVVEGVGR